VRLRGTLLIAALAGIPPAHGADNVGLAGTEYSGLGSYTYAGIVTPLTSEHLGNGIVMRHWLERLTYEYDAGTTRIHAERYAYAPALGYQSPFAGGSIGVYGGLRIAHLDLTPDDPGNDEEGHTNRVFFDLDAFTPLGARAENQVIASFETKYDDYYFRDRLMFRTGERYLFGPEAIVKGGRDYKGWQAGLALGGIRLGEKLGLVVRGGISAQDGESNTAYGSLEFAMDL